MRKASSRPLLLRPSLDVLLLNWDLLQDFQATEEAMPSGYLQEPSWAQPFLWTYRSWSLSHRSSHRLLMWRIYPLPFVRTPGVRTPGHFRLASAMRLLLLMRHHARPSHAHWSLGAALICISICINILLLCWHAAIMHIGIHR